MSELDRIGDYELDGIRAYCVTQQGVVTRPVYDIEQMVSVIARLDQAEAEREAASRSAAYHCDELAKLLKSHHALESILTELPDKLREWWSFDSGQQHTHTWHDREEFVENLRERIAEARGEGEG